MHSLLIGVSFAVLLCGAAAHNHDSDKGVRLGDDDVTINGIDCPVWAVSYNAIWLDCALNINGLDFTLGNSRLRAGYENGKLYLKLGQLSSIPEKNSYKLMVNRGSEVLAALEISPKMVPKPAVLNRLSTLGYGVRSGNVTILNSKTIYLPEFSYDGRAPDAFFWVGKGKPSSEGSMIPDENGSTNILRGYNRKSIMLKLPDDITVEDIDYLSVWCRDFRHDFGNVMIPMKLMVPPATYMPLVDDYSSLRITAIDGTSMLKFDSLPREGNGKAGLESSVFFILLAALIALFK